MDTGAETVFGKQGHTANGFYRLIDRHSDAGDGQNLLERASLNVTLAVYDADSDTLYFCEMDT